MIKKKFIKNTLCIAASVMMAAPVPSYAANAKKNVKPVITGVKKTAKNKKAVKKTVKKKKTIKTVTVTAGKTVKLNLKKGKGKTKWTTSNKKIATVNKKGVVKGIKAGTAKITAKVGKKKYTCKIVVKKAKIKKANAVKKAAAKTKTAETTKKAVTNVPSTKTSSASNDSKKETNKTTENNSAVSDNSNENKSDDTYKNWYDDDFPAKEDPIGVEAKTTTADITMSNDTRIVTNQSDNVASACKKHMKDGKQYIEVTHISKENDIILTEGYDDGNGGKTPYTYVNIHINGHTYQVDPGTYIWDYNNFVTANPECYVQIDKVIS